MRRKRSEAEILCGARILQDFTLLATQTYEGKPVTTGILVTEEWALKSSRHWSWIIKWPENCLSSVNQRSNLMAIAALADGKRSLIAADTTGRIFGIINLRDLVGLLINTVGYVVITNRHREVFLFGGGYGNEPVCFHNGFEWRCGGYIGPLTWVDYWAHYEKEKHLYDQVERGELPVDFPTLEDSRRWLAFDDIIEALSERRLSSIFAICDSATLKVSNIKSHLSSLRPGLDNVQWGSINNNIPVWVNLFKLDGAHVLSKNMRILAVCQRISVPTNYGGAEGTGRTAARFLSEVLSKSGVVIKVSSDGPTSVFYKGQIVDNWIQLP